MAKLNDTQSLLLAHAAQSESGSFYPLPASLLDGNASSERARKAIDQLLKRAFAEEREATTASPINRTDGDLSFGYFITTAGLQAIGVGTGGDAIAAGAGAVLPAPAVTVARQTKGATVLALLQRENGATLEELIAATGWLPHTTRAALTGLRKKGNAIDKGKRGDATCYRIALVAKAAA